MGLKERLQAADGKPVLGAFLGLAVPQLAEVVGRAGFDFLILDGEHGVFTPETTEECLRAASAVGMPALVRIPEADAGAIQAALDAGAEGVQVPGTETADQARSIVAASHFPPTGRRGFGSTTRAAGYGFTPRPMVVERAAANVLVVVQIETRRGVDNLDEILAVDGVDLVFLGTNDMSLDYGYKSPADPAMLPVLEDTIGRIRRSGRLCGMHVTDWDLLPHMKSLGVSYFTIASVVVMGQALIKLGEDFARMFP